MLYLQADNCGRENKNHALFSYLGWLVERGVFKEIHLSYFHVGHTHFGPDQVASRISCCARCADIHTRAENARILTHSYNPNLDFEHLDHVVNCQDLFFGPKVTNEETGKSYRSYARCHGSVIKKLNLISTIRHVKFSMGVDSKAKQGAPKTRVMYQVKPSAGAPWSAYTPLFWHSPCGLSFDGWESPSGEPNMKREWGESLAKTPAETKPLADEAEKGLAAVKGRISEDSFQSCTRDIEKLRNPPKIPFHWKDGGRFAKDQQASVPAEEEEDMALVPFESENQCVSKYRNRSEWATASVAKDKVSVGSMVLFTSYASTNHAKRWEAAPRQNAPKSDKRPFWYVGKVKEILPGEEGCLVVHWYHATPHRSIAQKCRPFTAGGKFVLVEPEDVFLTFPGLTKNGVYSKKVKKGIGQWLALGGEGIKAVADTSYDVPDDHPDDFEPDSESESEPESEEPVSARGKRRAVVPKKDNGKKKKRRR